MDLLLYNSLSRKQETFAPLHPDLVGVYSCGPTVYGTQHIGNFRAFMTADLLVRTLRYNGYQVRWVMNITDVGHLVSDADDGEDKLQRAAQKEGRTAWDVAREYTDQFLLDWDRFGLERPDAMPRATDFIAQQIALVEQLETKGHTYRTSDGIYFDTSTLSHYGQLAGQQVADKEAGARVDMGEKRNASDFALWKFSPAGEQRDMEWESPWGVGFPGWHLECTAMSTAYLGALYDIHTGGQDHKMVHHPNEMAQAEGALGTTEARVWMHNGFLQVDGGKMAKSLGNTYSADDLLAHGVDPLAFRYLVLTSDYRQPLNFTWESVEAAQVAWKRLRTTVRAWDTPGASASAYDERFLEAINQDVNMPRAIALVWELVHDTALPTSAKAQSLLKYDQVLGLGLRQVIARPLDIPAEVQVLLRERQAARDAKEWAVSDTLRDQIREAGFHVDDGPSGQVVTEL